MSSTQLECRHWDPWGSNAETAREVLARCLAQRDDLPQDHERELTKLVNNVLVSYPHEAFDIVGDFRRSFIAPVPNRLEERLGKR